MQPNYPIIHLEYVFPTITHGKEADMVKQCYFYVYCDM